MRQLEGKLALITGGAKNVGKVISRELASRGAHVLVNYFHSADDARRTQAELSELGASVDLIRASVAQRDQVDRMFAEIEERFGYLDILINNAADGALVAVADIADKHLDKAISTNYKGSLWCSRAAAPLMARRGGGSIIMVSALGGSQMVMANYLACAGAKSAAETVARYLAAEYAQFGIRVNTASAAMLVSEVSDAFPRAAEMQAAIRAATPLGRLGKADDFAKLVAFLASDDASWITGQVILADGGLTLGSTLLSPPPEQAAPPVEAAGTSTAPAVQIRPSDATARAAVLAGPSPASSRQQPAGHRRQSSFSDEDEIAVVGMGLAVAGANSPEQFWRLRNDGAELFVPVPRDRWDQSTFFSADMTAEDKSYQDTCVFITAFEPADQAGADDPDHELTTMWLRHSLIQALEGVHYDQRDRCAFLVGYTPDGSQHLEEAGVLAGMIQRLRRIAEDLDIDPAERRELLDGAERALASRYRRGVSRPSRFLPHRVGQLAAADVLPPDTEMHMVDTACSSSLYAIDIGIKGLLMGKHDIAICGGAFALAPRGTVLFSKLQGLSRRGVVHSLDKSADGVIFADGAGIVVLKRLRQALADEDQVHGVLSAFGSSSDGKGKAIYAPSASGQGLAVQRALDGGIRSRDVDWIIAHATGTPAGDLAEFTMLRQHFGVERTSYVTSNKSLIGHTGWAAGVISLIEALLGMRHQVIPRQFRFSEAPADFQVSTTKLRIPSAPVPWPDHPDRLRAAAVSGFGFGGTNAHLIVREHRPGSPRGAPHANDAASAAPRRDERIAIVGWSARVPGLRDRADVVRWLSEGDIGPASSFGEFYPPPAFSTVRLAPPTLRTVDRCQLMIVECAHDLRAQLTDFWQEHSLRTGTFVGNMGPTRAAMLYANRCYLDDATETLLAALPGARSGTGPSTANELLSRLRAEIRSQIPSSSEDSFPGIMPNIISARVANYFDLKGPNITLDSGLASTLTAIETATRYLRSGEVDFALAGGINGNTLPEYETLLTDLLNPHGREGREGGTTGPDGREQDKSLLAEGVFMVALATETAARKADLKILGYVGELRVGDTRPHGSSIVDCGIGTKYARYLGAAGGFAVLRALHQPAGSAIVCHGGAGSALIRMDVDAPDAVPGTAAVIETAPTPPKTALVYRHVPALAPMQAREPVEGLPFLPPGVVVLTDRPELVASLPGLPADALVLCTGPTPCSQPTPERGPRQWHLLEVSADAMRQVLAEHGKPVKHLRVVTDLSRSAPLPESLERGARHLITLSDVAFLVLQSCYHELGADGSSFLTLLLGAMPGNVPHPISGIFTGLAKCARLELPNCVTLAIGTAATNVGQGIRVAEHAAATRQDFPVVFEADGTLYGHVLSRQDAAVSNTTAIGLGPDSTVLAVGGARGITAEVVKALAREFHPRIYLIGSNPLKAYPAGSLPGGNNSFTGDRQEFIRRGVAQGQPVRALASEFDRLVAARQARLNISELTALCGDGRVTYLSCDVRDGEAVAAAVDKILSERQQVDLLINAAGRNRSALIKDKPLAEFAAIRDIKLEGYRNLRRAFGDRQPRTWCNFGSLLGYFGQVGEADYAAGNDFLATAGTYSSTVHDRDEFTVGWTLWDGAGMGADELTNAYYRRAGSYSHVSVDEGCAHFMRELHVRPRPPSTVHIGAAERTTLDRFYPGYLAASDLAQDARGAADGRFYLRRQVSADSELAVFECLFDLAVDGYFAHHTVRGVPTLPGTFVTEIAAEAALALVPDMQVIAFENIEFHHFLQLHPHAPARPRRITARVTERAGDLVTVDVAITTDVVSPAGVLLVKDKPHFTARVLMRESFPRAPRWPGRSAADEVNVPDPYYADDSPVRLTGPFVASDSSRWSPAGMRSRYCPDLRADDPVWPRFVVAPILLDALARSGVLSVTAGHLIPIAAPLSVRRVDLYERANDLDLMLRYGHLELHAMPADFTMEGEQPGNRFVAATTDGRVIAQLKDVRARAIGYLDTRTGAVQLSRQSIPGTAAAAGAPAVTARS